MKKIFLFIAIIFNCVFCGAQAKTELLNRYFLGIPVTDSLRSIEGFIKSSPLLGIDSIVKPRGLYTSYKQPSPYAVTGNHLIKALVTHLVYYDSISKEFYDTSNRVLISYYFSPGHKKNRDELYKQIKKSFEKHYKFRSNFHGAQNDTLWEGIDFRGGAFDNFPELRVYKGYAQVRGLHLSLLYDRRTFYQIFKPKLSSIRVSSF